jgi:hypothetical protein
MTMRRLTSLAIFLAAAVGVPAWAASPVIVYDPGTSATVAARDVLIDDAGDYYTGTETETALQEVAASSTLHALRAGDTFTGTVGINPATSPALAMLIRGILGLGDTQVYGADPAAAATGEVKLFATETRHAGGPSGLGVTGSAGTTSSDESSSARLYWSAFGTAFFTKSFRTDVSFASVGDASIGGGLAIGTFALNQNTNNIVRFHGNLTDETDEIPEGDAAFYILTKPTDRGSSPMLVAEFSNADAPTTMAYAMEGGGADYPGTVRVGGLIAKMSSVAAATSLTVTADDVSYVVTAEVNVDLPDPTTCLSGRILAFKSTHANGCTIGTHNNDNDIDGTTPQHYLAQYESIWMQTDGTNWYRMMDYD